jgi:hypothetical protein
VLSPNPEPPQPGPHSYIFDFQGGLRLGKQVELNLRFLYDDPPLGVEAWLRQEVVSPGITIKGLIDQLANKTAAHADDEVSDVETWGATLRFTGPGQRRALHRMALVSIGEYVSERAIALLGGPTIRFDGDVGTITMPTPSQDQS